MQIKNSLRYLLSALIIFITTITLNYKVGLFGYISLCDLLILLLLKGLNPSYAMLAAGISTAIADILLGYRANATMTFIIRAVEGFVCAYLFNKDKNSKLIALIICGISFVAFTLFDIFTYGQPLFLISIKMNGLQALCNFFSYIIISCLIKKIGK